MHHFHHLPIVACALALAACGGEATNEASPQGTEVGESTAKPASAGDPCAFISKEEIAAITGETIVQTKAEDDTCRYETDDAMASSVQVDIKQSGGKEEMEIARTASGALGSIGDEMKNSGGAEGDTGEMLAESAAAPKIGDQAFFGANSQLHVLKGDVYFSVLPPHMRSRMSAGNPMLQAEKKREIAAKVAEKIASKL